MRDLSDKLCFLQPLQRAWHKTYTNKVSHCDDRHIKMIKSLLIDAASAIRQQCRASIIMGDLQFLEIMEIFHCHKATVSSFLLHLLMELSLQHDYLVLDLHVRAGELIASLKEIKPSEST